MLELLQLITGLGVPERFAKPALAGALFIAALLLLLGAKAIYDRSVVDHHEAKIEQRAKPATDQAAAERATDAIANTKTEQETHNAIAAQPDQPIAPTSHAHACLQLRRAGVDSPACR